MTRYFYHIEGREEINFLSSDIMTAEEAQEEVGNMCFGENEGVTLYRAYIFDDKDVEGFDVEEYIEDSFNGCDDTFEIKEIGCKPSIKTPLYREYVIKGGCFGVLLSDEWDFNIVSPCFKPAPEWRETWGCGSCGRIPHEEDDGMKNRLIQILV